MRKIDSKLHFMASTLCTLEEVCTCLEGSKLQPPGQVCHVTNLPDNMLKNVSSKRVLAHLSVPHIRRDHRQLLQSWLDFSLCVRDKERFLFCSVMRWSAESDMDAIYEPPAPQMSRDLSPAIS